MSPRFITLGLALVVATTGAALAQLSPGDMNCDGTVNGLDIAPFVDCLLTGNCPPCGILQVSPSDGLMSSGLQGGPFSPSEQVYTLQNNGGQSLDWTASKTQSWVSLSGTSGTLAAGASTTVTVSINSAATSLAAGSYNDTVSFTNTTSHSGDTTRGVNLSVNPPPGALSVTPGTGLVSSGTVGGPFSPSEQVYTLQNTGGQSLDWTASKTQSWVSLSGTSGTLVAGASTTVTVSINSAATSLAAGSYNDTVSFTNTTSHSGDATRGVNLTVNPPPGALSVTPGTDLVSSGAPGGPFNPSEQVYTLQNTGGQSLDWTASKTQDWVTLSAASGTLGAGASTTVTVSINSAATSLAAGSYNDTVSFTNTTNGEGNTSRGVSLTVDPSIPLGMVLIPAGEFQMGDTFTEGGSSEQPVHAVSVGAFYMDACEVTNQQYADGLNWAYAQGGLITVTDGVVYEYNTGTSYPYCDTTTSSSYSRITWNSSTFGVVSGKESHPMVMVSWYGSVAYANWRSGMQGKPLGYDLSSWTCNFGSGYRLPTEAEWEKAARGGAAGHRFPWSDADTIQHARANYYSDSSYSYDTSPTRGYHPTFGTGALPYTSPVGYFAANSYGLYDVAGNVWEWCNDWYSSSYYGSSPYGNPHGPASGSYRVLRGGGWSSLACYCRCAFRNAYLPNGRDYYFGFRLTLDAE